MVLNHAQELKCKQLELSEIQHLKDYHTREVLQHLGVPVWRVASFVKKLRKMANMQVDEIHIFPEWPDILKQLHQNHHRLGIISSNAYSTVECVLKKYHLLELFDFISCEKSVFGKKRALSKLIRQKHLTPSATYYVGDEARDIEAAQMTKIHSIAVAWGFNSAKRLIQARPSYLVESMEQLKEIFANEKL